MTQGGRSPGVAGEQFHCGREDGKDFAGDNLANVDDPHRPQADRYAMEGGRSPQPMSASTRAFISSSSSSVASLPL